MTTRCKNFFGFRWKRSKHYFEVDSRIRLSTVSSRGTHRAPTAFSLLISRAECWLPFRTTRLPWCIFSSASWLVVSLLSWKCSICNRDLYLSSVIMFGKPSVHTNSSIDQYSSIDNFFTLDINIGRAKNRYISATVVFFQATNRNCLLRTVFVV